MHRLSQFTICFVLILYSTNPALAQDDKPTDAQRAALTVTASATGERVRFTAPSSVVQIRLEVYDSVGRKLFDNEVRGGNVLDWRLQDGQAERLQVDTYLCVVTVKILSGRLTQKIANVVVEPTAARLQAVDGAQLTAQQSQAIGPVEEDSALTILREEEPVTTTVIAHNGEEGQITRSKGPLTFRLGDFFSGKDQEQMRLTAEGNLGIGTTNPQAKLDVAGLIRASDGIKFPDGSVQYSAAKKTLGAASSKPDQQGNNPSAGQEHIEPQATGTGTQNRLAKWTDNAGAMGDSSVTDTGFLAIDSNSNPLVPGSGTLIIQGNANKERVELRSAGPIPGPALQGRGFGGTIAAPTATVANSDLFIIGGSGHNGSDIVTYNAGTIKIKAEENWTGTGNGAYINFETTPSGSNTFSRVERMRITGDGRVGIGASNPGSKLHVDGGSGPAVLGISNGATGVNGNSKSGTGVFGSSGSGTGVWGNSSTGWAGYFEGKVYVTNGITVSPYPGSGFAGAFAGKVHVSGNVGIGTANPVGLLHVNGPSPVRILGETATLSGSEYVDFFARSSVPGSPSDLGGMRIQRQATGNIDTLLFAAQGENAAAEVMRVSGSGRVGIGLTDPQARLDVRGGSAIAVYGLSNGSSTGVVGESDSGNGVRGNSLTGPGVYAYTNGSARFNAALRSDNPNSNGGMAAYLTNNSNFHNAHFRNSGSGGVLYLQNGGDSNGAGGGDFITALDNAEADVQFRVLSSGEVRSDIGFNTPAADFAEMLPANDGLEAGDVLVIGKDGKLALSWRPRQTCVAGVYSTKPGFVGGLPVNGERGGKVPLAVTGIVPVKVTTENGPIRPGDLLTTSSTPGHAMGAGARSANGTVIGKALGTLKSGRGVIQMIAVLQ